jgi:hypothetical protein
VKTARLFLDEAAAILRTFQSGYGNEFVPDQIAAFVSAKLKPLGLAVKYNAAVTGYDIIPCSHDVKTFVGPEFDPFQDLSRSPSAEKEMRN